MVGDIDMAAHDDDWRQDLESFLKHYPDGIPRVAEGGPERFPVEAVRVFLDLKREAVGRRR